jgi:hypothetical protein
LLYEARAEERVIRNYLDEEKLVAMRSKLLSIFWTLVKDWDENGQRQGSILLPTFESWSRIVDGIVENAGFVSPCLLNNLKTGGDTYIRDMEMLVSEMVPGTEYTFSWGRRLSRQTSQKSYVRLRSVETPESLREQDRYARSLV